MAINILVSPEHLEVTSRRILNHSNEYKCLVNLMYTETDSMKAAWSGKDIIAYTHTILKFKEDFEKMYVLMESYAHYLMSCARAYQNTQDSIQLEAKRLLEW